MNLLNIKENVEAREKDKKFVSGHRTCMGCGIPLIVRNVLSATESPIVVSNATGCLEVTSTIYPFTSWNVPYIHNAFENAAPTLSGVEAAYNVLKKKGKIKKEIKFIAFGGDGGTYDIGLQSLSAALERGHDFVYVLYDNEAYMNTGVQRSSATPFGAATTTTPEGKFHHGKEVIRKDITRIMVAHNIPYVAQAAIHNWADLVKKAKTAFETKGPCFLNVLSPCPLGWGTEPKDTIKVSKLATETNFWPLYEVINGEYRLNYRPAKQLPIEDYLQIQGRFKHLFKPENSHLINRIQNQVNGEWNKLLKLCGDGVGSAGAGTVATARTADEKKEKILFNF